METKNKSFRVFFRILETWAYTLIGMSGLIAVTVFLLFLARRFLSIRILLVLVSIAFVLGLLLYVFSMKIVITAHNMQRADEKKYKDFYEVCDELCKQFWFLKEIPLFIWRDSSMNACAFGPGFGFAGIAITPALYKALSRDQLKAVIAHEIAHIRCKDVGIFCFILILNASLEIVGRWLIAFAAMSWVFPAAILGGLMLLLRRVFFPIGQAAISKEREYTADKLASGYCNGPDHLVSGLEIVCGDKNKANPPSLFEGLWLSHPLLGNRILNLIEGTYKETPSQKEY